MELTLKLLSGSSAGKEIKIPVDKFFIGRADDCHLRPHSDLISRHHCALLIQDSVVAVRDFGSRNGTFVITSGSKEAERVVGQRELANGDKLKVGNLEFEIQLTSSVGGKKLPKVKDVKDAAVRTATGKPSDSSPDDDISDWLALDEQDAQRDIKRIDVRETAPVPHHETPASLPSSLRETTMVKSLTEDTQTGKPPESTPAQPAAPEAAKSGAGKFSTPPGKSSKDSREAAADALKKLFNARR